VLPEQPPEVAALGPDLPRRDGDVPVGAAERRREVLLLERRDGERLRLAVAERLGSDPDACRRRDAEDLVVAQAGTRGR
jgi:hypothetical protein